MRHLTLGLAVVCLALFGVGCVYQAPVVPPVGLIYSNIDSPLTTEYAGQPVEQKSGQASTTSILGLVAWGDCSIKAAAESGQLQYVNYADYEYYNVLGVYQKFTIIAHGK